MPRKVTLDERIAFFENRDALSELERDNTVKSPEDLGALKELKEELAGVALAREIDHENTLKRIQADESGTAEKLPDTDGLGKQDWIDVLND